jgi:hypothetical protein
LDLFTITDFKTDDIIPVLLKEYSLHPVLQMPQTLICQMDDVKVDFIRFNYPFIRPVITMDGIRMLSIEDIAPMKLDAVTGRGSKKVFFDYIFCFNNLVWRNFFLFTRKNILIKPLFI